MARGRLKTASKPGTTATAASRNVGVIAPEDPWRPGRLGAWGGGHSADGWSPLVAAADGCCFGASTVPVIVGGDGAGAARCGGGSGSVEVVLVWGVVLASADQP